jgi:hypothetical protein
MTTSHDRIDRIEDRLEQIEALVEKNAQAIGKLTDSPGAFTQHYTNGDLWMRWMMQLAFVLLISATVALVVNATAFLVKLWLPS